MKKINDIKTKHDHKLTDWLKFGIFAIVMLAPFFAIATECLYMICNKNAPANYTGTQQDVFYNAVNNMVSKPLFNWTTQTGIYIPINQMLTGLDIAGGALPIILTYWSLMTLIYIVFDIIIKTFTALTHLLN